MMLHIEDEVRPHMLTDEQVAQIAHEANRQYLGFLGTGVLPWDDLGQGGQRAVIDSVNAYRTGRQHSPADTHGNWLRMMAAQGWTYGPVKDEEAKTDPNIVPYESLPITQQRIDMLFVAIVKALSYGSVDRWASF